MKTTLTAIVVYEGQGIRDIERSTGGATGTVKSRPCDDFLGEHDG